MLRASSPFPLQKHLLLMALLSFLITLVYLPVKNFEYLAIDDGMHTEVNPKLNPVSLENIYSFWKEPYENAYTPLTYTLWSLEALIAKNNPAQQIASRSKQHPDGLKFDSGVFHAFNAITHLGGTLLVYLFLFLLFRHPKGAFLGSLIFGLHPLQVETVCWITAQRDLLAGLLSIATLIFYVLYSRSVPTQKVRASKLSIDFVYSTLRNPYYLLAFTFYALSVLSKSSSLIIPLFVAIIALSLLKTPLLRIVMDLTPWILLISPILQIFTSLNDSVALKVVFIPQLQWRFVIALDAIGFYLSKLFYPIPLVMDYGRTPQWVLNHTQYVWTIGILGIVSLFSVGFVIKKRVWGPFICLLIFAVGLIPVSGITPFIFQHISTVADRYIYLSVIALGLGTTLLVIRYERFRFFRVFTYGVVFVCIFLSCKQVRVWKNNYTLFSHTLLHTPQSWLAANDLGTVFEMKGESKEAYDLYTHAAKLSNIASAWNNSGAMAVAMKDYNAAIDSFRKALNSSERAPWAYNNLGTANALAGNLAEARLAYQKALELAPQFDYPKENLATLKRGRLADLEKLKVIRKN